MASRGMITEKIKTLSKDSLGYEINQDELRLMPYLQSVMVNEQKLDPNKITEAERHILSRWREMGFIEGGAGGLSISREFWDAINAIIWHGYVATGQ